MKRTLRELKQSTLDVKESPSKKAKVETTEEQVPVAIKSKQKWIDMDGALVEYYPRFMTKSESKTLFDALMKSADWQRDTFKFMGKESLSPRLVSAFGEKGLEYYYTGQTRIAQEWIPELQSLKEKIEQHTGEQFNYVLVNRYDNGQNYIGWHSDKRTNLTPGSSIVSVSLGQERTFQFKRISTKVTEVSKNLGDGSMLVMNEKTQDLYKHCLPKRANVNGKRLNLTFRSVVNKNKQT